MATVEEVIQAIGCLSTTYPQFVAKEVSIITDQIATSIQGFTDPLAALGDLSIDTLVDDVATLSEGDVFENLGAAAVGLAGQHVKREAAGIVDDLSTSFPGITKRVQDIRNLSGKVATTGSLMLSIFPDIPYAAAQKMCETIIRLAELKRKNLECLKKHVVQLSNAMLLLACNVLSYKDDTFKDLDDAAGFLAIVKKELINSQRLSGGITVFDAAAFERARQAMISVNALLTPDKDGTSILDATDILTFGSVSNAEVSRANRSLTTMVIPSLINLIETETSAADQQVTVINHFVTSLQTVIVNFRKSGESTQVREMRARGIAAISARVTELCSRIDLARDKKALVSASGEMLFWASRVKTIIATMDRIKETALQEGSIEGPDKAVALASAFSELLEGLTGIENNVTTDGVEDFTILRTQIRSLSKGGLKLMRDLEKGTATENRVASFHTLALTVAAAQSNGIDASISVAQQQKVACGEFAEIEMQVRERYDELLDSMRQLGLDRAVDLLGTGSFDEFLDSDLDSLSYVGAAIKCLTDALGGIDDVQTRQQITSIRDDLVGKKTNEEVAAADSADQGRSRLVSNLKDSISAIQRNAKTVESIVEELKVVAEQLGGTVSDTFTEFDSFLGNVDQLAVGAGGRLADGLEEFSDHPNAGVPLCESV